MFQSLTLNEAYQLLSSPAEWAEFSELEASGATSLLIVVIGAPETPFERRVRRYEELRGQFISALRAKLLSGEWVAEGFNPAVGPQPLEIDPRLWRVLEINLEGHATGGGFSFVNLMISQRMPKIPQQEHLSKAKLRVRLREWIEEYARSTPGPKLVEEVLMAAREAFTDEYISRNLFDEVWPLCEKPTGFVQRGRPSK